MNASANAAGGRLRQGAAEISPAKTDLRMGAQPEGARKELRLFEGKAEAEPASDFIDGSLGTKAGSKLLAQLQRDIGSKCTEMHLPQLQHGGSPRHKSHPPMFGGGGYRTGAPCSLPGYEPAWLSSLPPITNAPPRKTRRSPCLGRPETLQLGLEKCRCTKSRCCNICRREFTNEGCRREFTNEGGSAAWLEREKKETLSFVQLAPYLPGGEAPALACLDSLHSSGGSRLWMIARSRLAHAQCSQQNHFLKLLRAKFTYSGVENIL